jgi:hypothetical protein
MKNLKTKTVAAPRQLEMAFESDVIASLCPVEERAVVTALARLLLAAGNVTLEDQSDEQ